jgi:hypothetical protein
MNENHPHLRVTIGNRLVGGATGAEVLPTLSRLEWLVSDSSKCISGKDRVAVISIFASSLDGFRHNDTTFNDSLPFEPCDGMSSVSLVVDTMLFYLVIRCKKMVFAVVRSNFVEYRFQFSVIQSSIISTTPFGRF